MKIFWNEHLCDAYNYVNSFMGDPFKSVITVIVLCPGAAAELATDFTPLIDNTGKRTSVSVADAPWLQTSVASAMDSTVAPEMLAKVKRG